MVGFGSGSPDTTSPPPGTAVGLSREIRNMDDVTYMSECVDPVFRPLIEDMSRHMPARPTMFIRDWVRNPPPLNVSVRDRKEYFEKKLGPIMQ